jgi:hypothetical protein
MPFEKLDAATVLRPRLRSWPTVPQGFYALSHSSFTQVNAQLGAPGYADGTGNTPMAIRENRPDTVKPPEHVPLCRGCHRPMAVIAIEPHARYKNLDTYHFRCTCGSATTALVARRQGAPCVH